MAIGPRVRERRIALGLSQEQLARRADISLNAMGKLETGRITDPHYSTLSGIAHALGTTVAELVGEEESVLAGPKAKAAPKTGRLQDAKGPDPLGGWIERALSEGDFARAFERAKSAQKLADALHRAKLAEATERQEAVDTRREQGAQPAEIQEARRDRAVSNAQLTAAAFLAVEQWRGHDVSGMDPRAIVADVLRNQRELLLAGGRDEGESTAQAGENA